MDIDQNIALYREMITCNNTIYTWCYDSEYHLLFSNCPKETLFSTIFLAFGCKDFMYKYAEKHSSPLMLGTPLGLIWMAAFEKTDGGLKRIHTIGPVFTTDVSPASIEEVLNRNTGINISLSTKHELLDELRKIPVLSHILLNQYVLMLHYCVTGEKLSTSDVHNQNYADILPGDEADAQDAPMHDRYKTWMNEQVLLSMVREGNLNFKSAIDKSAVISAGVPVRGRDPMRQAKDSVIVFISLCTRAGIEGGMLPEQAYSLGDSYIQSVEDASIHSEIAALAYAMYEDFIRRVNKRRANPQIAKQIQKCCDYIDLHAEEKINVEDIAKRVGYTKYYLTRKFKEEMKCSLNDYIRQVRTERAKLLLTTTDLSIQDIADKLGFCSRSYFSEVFRVFAGCSPVDFREQNKKG